MMHLHRMRLFSRVLIYVLSGCLLSSGLASVASAQATAEKEAELKSLNQNIEQLQQELDRTKRSRAQLEKELQQSEKSIEALEREVDSLEKQLKEDETKQNALNQQSEQAKHQKNQQTAEASTNLNAIWRLQQQPPLQWLLSAQSPHETARSLRLYQYLLGARQQQIIAWQQQIAELQALEQQLINSQKALAAKQKLLAQNQQQLKRQQQKRHSTLVQLNTEIHSDQAKLQALTQQRQQLENILARMRTEAIAQKRQTEHRGLKENAGRLPVKGTIAHRFGESRLGGSMQWQGLDIHAPEGAIVHAMADGLVVFSDYLKGFGWLIIIDHGKGYMTLYANCQTLIRHVGHKIIKDEPIAKVGTSGGRTEPGLYFEVRYNSSPVDPMHWINQQIG